MALSFRAAKTARNPRHERRGFLALCGARNDSAHRPDFGDFAVLSAARNPRHERRGFLALCGARNDSAHRPDFGDFAVLSAARNPRHERRGFLALRGARNDRRGLPFRGFFIVVFALFCILPAHSQTSTNPDLQRIRGEIAHLRQRLDDLHARTRTAEQELEAVDLELGIRTRELEIAQRLEADLVQQQNDLAGQIRALGVRIGEQRRFLRKRLVALYRLGRLSYLRILLSIDQRRDPLDAMSMLTYLASRDARSIERFNDLTGQLRSRSAELADRQQKVVRARQVIQQRQQEVAAVRARKERLVATLRDEKAKSENQIAALEEKAVRLERLIDVLSRQSGGAPVEADIRTFAGALGWPVQGTVIEHFGRLRDPKFSTLTFNNGLKIAAPAGTEVRAIFPGTVLYSQWFKGYGNLIILDHGNRVFSLYGNLKSPAVAVGDRVRAGQTIAGVGESEESELGYLYFEIRQDNKPEDPQKWLR